MKQLLCLSYLQGTIFFPDVWVIGIDGHHLLAFLLCTEDVHSSFNVDSAAVCLCAIERCIDTLASRQNPSVIDNTTVAEMTGDPPFLLGSPARIPCTETLLVVHRQRSTSDVSGSGRLKTECDPGSSKEILSICRMFHFDLHIKIVLELEKRKQGV